MSEYDAGMVVQDRCRCDHPDEPHVRYRIQHVSGDGARGVLLLNLGTGRMHRTSIRRLETGYDVVVNVDTGELAPRPERPPRDRNLSGHNEHRSAEAAARVCAEVRRALDVLGDDANPLDVQAGRLRLKYPAVSLAELGALAVPPLSKDAVAGRIRRLLVAAREETGRRVTEEIEADPDEVARLRESMRQARVGEHRPWREAMPEQ